MASPFTLVSIDPSIRNLGIAAHILEKRNGLWSPMLAGWSSMHQGPETGQVHYMHRVRVMVEAIEIWIQNVEGPGPIAVVMELPTNWSSQRGQASKDAGAIQSLYAFCGALAGALFGNPRVMSFWFVTPIEWKGSTPKEIMVKRSEDYFVALTGKEVPRGVSHDPHEALLLGAYAIRHLRADGSFKAPLELYRQRFKCGLVTHTEKTYQ